MNPRPGRLRALLVLALLALPGGARADTLVFAAASLQGALDAAIEASGVAAKASYAASSTLARQIEGGAEAGLFISANPEWMDYLATRGLIDAGSRRDLLGNTLVLVAPLGGAPAGGLDLPRALPAALGGGRLAVGDPDHVPAGIYAKEALEHLGLWKDLAPRLARADNVRGALALVERGEAPLGIVYGTDAEASDRVETVATFPDDGHAPIRYPAALTRAADAGAKRLLAFLEGDVAAEIFRAHGFTVLAGP